MFQIVSAIAIVAAVYVWLAVLFTNWCTRPVADASQDYEDET